MKYWRVKYDWPAFPRYGVATSCKWARTAKDAENAVKKALKGNIRILEVNEQRTTS